jgi:hypothetical protein
MAKGLAPSAEDIRNHEVSPGEIEFRVATTELPASAVVVEETSQEAFFVIKWDFPPTLGQVSVVYSHRESVLEWRCREQICRL